MFQTYSGGIPSEYHQNSPRTSPEHSRNTIQNSPKHPQTSPPNPQVSVRGEHIGVSVRGVHIWRAASSPWKDPPGDDPGSLDQRIRHGDVGFPRTSPWVEGHDCSTARNQGKPIKPDSNRAEIDYTILPQTRSTGQWLSNPARIVTPISQSFCSPPTPPNQPQTSPKPPQTPPNHPQTIPQSPNHPKTTPKPSPRHPKTRLLSRTQLPGYMV